MDHLHVRDLSIDPARRLVLRSGVPVAMSIKAFDLLLYMAKNPGRPLLKEELLSAVWPGTTVEESNLTHAVYQLRKALAASGSTEPDPILTLPGRGYQLAVTITSGSPTTPASPPQPATPPPATSTRPSRHLLRTILGFVCAMALVAAVLLFVTGSQATLHISSTVQLTDDGVIKHLFLSRSNLFNDGTRLHFIEQLNNRSYLADVPVNGGEVHTVPAPATGSALVGYSGLNHTLLFGSDWHVDDTAPILAQPLGGSAAQIGDLTGHDASWSPDAHRLAIAKDRFLYVSNPDGSNLHRIASANGVVFMPRWSPDGQLLRFSVNGGGFQNSIWQVKPDGSDLHPLIPSLAQTNRICCGDWSADGANFFYLEEDTVTSSLWVLPERSRVNLRTPQPVQLTVNQNELWQPPLPAPDGRAVWAIGSHLRGQLVGLDPVTRKFRPILGGISAEGVSFSPDRQWIAYTAYPEGTLWISHPDGSSKRQLTQFPMLARFPQWSPDGRTIAFIADLPASSDWHIYLVPLSGGKPTLLLQEDAAEGVPNWSPDGTRISFGRLLDYGTEHDPDLTIEIYDLRKHSHSTLHGSEGLWTPRWSPDGRFLTAVTQDNHTLRLYDFQTSQWSDLASLGVNDAIWSRDSRYVYFDTSLGNDATLYRIPFDPARPGNHQPERWADLHGLHRGGFFDPWLGITPDGEPLVLIDTSIEEVYRLNLDTSK